MALAAFGLVCLLQAAPLLAASDDLKPFFGAYVGVADVEDPRTGVTQQRDMDIVIEPFHEDGFRIHWVNVTLVDGRRDLPGVKRRIQTVLFEPSDERDFFVEVEADNPFREAGSTMPMRGDPVRWATITDGRMHVYSFVVLEDGRYEMQVYDRLLTAKGIDIRFQRILDGEIVRRIKGTTVRAE
jgi:hypothetical protein